MSAQGKAHKDVKGKGREVPVGGSASSHSGQINTNEQGAHNGTLGSLQDRSNLPTRPSSEVLRGTIRWLSSVQIPAIASTDQPQNHELHRTISEPGAGNSNALRPILVDVGEGIFRTLLRPGICASSNTPQPREEDNSHPRPCGAADANGMQIRTGFRPHSKSLPAFRRPIFSNPSNNSLDGSSENRGPVNIDDVLQLLCPALPNEFQTHTLFEHGSKMEAERQHPGLIDFYRESRQARKAHDHELGQNDFRNAAGSSAEITNNHVNQDRNRSQQHQPSPLSVVHTIEHAPLIDPPIMSSTARIFGNQVRNTLPMDQNHHTSEAQEPQDTPLIEPHIVSDAASNVHGSVSNMPSINQVLKQSTIQPPREVYVGTEQSHSLSAQHTQLPTKQVILSPPATRNEGSVTTVNQSDQDFEPPMFESSRNEGRQHSPQASTVMWSESPKSSWRRIWHSLIHPRSGCLCSLPAGDMSEADLDTYEANAHSAESNHQSLVPTSYARTLGGSESERTFLPPPRNSLNEEAGASEESEISENEDVRGQEADTASDSPTLVPPKSFIQRLKDRMKAAIEKRVADRAAKAERRRMTMTRRTRTEQEAETAARSEPNHTPENSKEEAIATGALMDDDR